MLRKDITQFTYSPSDLRRNIQSEDFWKFDLKSDDIAKITADLSDIFFHSNQKIDKLNFHNNRNNRIFTNSSLYNALTIRRTNEILKKRFFSKYIQEIKR